MILVKVCFYQGIHTLDSFVRQLPSSYTKLFAYFLKPIQHHTHINQVIRLIHRRHYWTSIHVTYTSHYQVSYCRCSYVYVIHCSKYQVTECPSHQVTMCPRDHVSPNRGNRMVVGRPHIRFQTVVPQCTLGGPKNPHYA